MVFGPYIGLNLANIDAYNMTFILCMIISAVNIVLAIFMRVPKHTHAEKQCSRKTKILI